MPQLGFTSKPAASQGRCDQSVGGLEVMSRVHGARTTGLPWRQTRLPSQGLLCLAKVDGDVAKRSVLQGGFAQSPLSLSPCPVTADSMELAGGL